MSKTKMRNGVARSWARAVRLNFLAKANVKPTVARTFLRQHKNEADALDGADNSVGVQTLVAAYRSMLGCAPLPPMPASPAFGVQMPVQPASSENENPHLALVYDLAALARSNGGADVVQDALNTLKELQLSANTGR